ncbi:hypothetical protein INT45_000167 [Circinella minor]|uniref:Uncharacterized protein n=1 Tax=Circinella minor TaxID=1195481 RepID=A0A8H7VMA1_9FUNG|nr:hypothetical protein INT45_000167 [Circinella minor]
MELHRKAIYDYLKVTTKPSFANFVDSNVEFIANNLPDDITTLDQYWSNLFEEVTEKDGVRLIKVRKPPNWTPILMHAIQLTKVTKSKSTSRGTKRSSKSDSSELEPEEKQPIIDLLRKLDDNKKWDFVRDNGETAFVENILADHVEKTEFEHSAISGIFNIGDKVWKSYLSDQELGRLGRAGSATMPSLPQSLQQIFDKVQSTLEDIIEKSKNMRWYEKQKAIVDVLYQRLLQFPPYDPYDDFNEHWTIEQLKEFCSLYRWHIPGRMSKDSSEMDYINLFWSRLDRCFDNLYMDTRRDVLCVANLARVNESRIIDGIEAIKDQNKSVRPDLVLVKNNVEFGTGECGKDDVAGVGKKELVETQLHGPKIMKDMFVRAARIAGDNEDFIRGFKVVSFNQTCMRMTTSVLDCPKGIVCRVRTSQEYEIPKDAASFAGIIPILKLALKAKIMVQESISIMEKYTNDRGTQEPDFMFEETQGVNVVKIPSCFTFRNKKQKSTTNSTPA